MPAEHALTATTAEPAGLAALLADLGRLDGLLADHAATLRIEAQNAREALALGIDNRLVAQLIGRRRVHLLAPVLSPHLVRAHGRAARLPDVAAEPDLARCAFIAELAPGDLLYLPLGWWHQARALDLSATATFSRLRWSEPPAEPFPG